MGDKQVKVAKRAKERKGENNDIPASERHIPWPEIFKHHISLVEGHTRMLEMIQKHTVKGRDNWDTITAMVIRSHEILRQAKDSSKSFVPPPNQQEKVPIGSSHESMYPGYSPGEIECVEASEVVNYIRSECTSSQSPANGTEHKAGQGHVAKRRPPQKDKENFGSGELGKNMTKVKSTGKPEDGEKALQDSKNGNKRGPSAVVDTDSTLAIPPQKPLEDRGREKGKKKPKTGREKGKEEEKVKDIVVETKDISAGAEARPMAKEAKARSKESKEKKRRRRESEDEDPDKVVKKPKKDQGKKREAEDRGSGGRESEDEDPNKVVKKLKKDKGKKREAEDRGSGGRDRKRQRKDAE